MLEEFVWVEKHRPKTINDTILPKKAKEIFQSMVDNGNIPNLLLPGSSGIGKTTVARALCEQLGCDYIVLNASMHGNIDTLRTDIANFASSVSFSGGRKYVILDEADYLNAQSTQPALRNFMEEFSANCGFILTCNFKNKILEALRSRCTEVSFTISKEEKPQLMMEFYKRTLEILDINKIEYDKKAIAEVINQRFPDWRRVLNDLQSYSATGRIDKGILTNLSDVNFKTLIAHMKDKDYDAVRKWVGSNSDMDPTTLYREIFDRASSIAEPSSIPGIIVALGEYQFKHAFVADPEINVMACLTEIMVEADWV